jgi:6-pyruvoyl-tetrahydropterin synthase
MVMDFARLGTVVGPLVDQLDHRYIVSFDNSLNNDPYVKAAGGADYNDHLVVPGIPFSTAECLATWFHQNIQRLVGGTFEVGVRLYETDTSFAEVTDAGHLQADQ